MIGAFQGTKDLVLIFIKTGWTEVFFRSRRHLHDFCPAVHFSGWSSRGLQAWATSCSRFPPRSSWAWTRPVGSWLSWKVCFAILRIKDFWNHLWQHHVNATFAFTANLPAIIIKVNQGCQRMCATVNRAILIFWLIWMELCLFWDHSRFRNSKYICGLFNYNMPQGWSSWRYAWAERCHPPSTSSPPFFCIQAIVYILNCSLSTWA